MINGGVGGSWKVGSLFVKVSNLWCPVKQGWVKVEGIWRLFYYLVAGVLGLKHRWALDVDAKDTNGPNPGVVESGAFFTIVDGKKCVDLKDGQCVRLPEMTLGNKPWTFTLWYWPRSFVKYSHLLTSSIVQGTFTLKIGQGSSAGVPYVHTAVLGSQMANDSIPLNKWSMITFAYDGTAVNIFVGKKLSRRVNASFNIPTTGFLIGAGAGIEYSDGYQRDTMFYNRALTSTEVAKIYDELV